MWPRFAATLAVGSDQRRANTKRPLLKTMGRLAAIQCAKSAPSLSSVPTVRKPTANNKLETPVLLNSPIESTDSILSPSILYIKLHCITRFKFTSVHSDSHPSYVRLQFPFNVAYTDSIAKKNDNVAQHPRVPPFSYRTKGFDSLPVDIVHYVSLHIT